MKKTILCIMSASVLCICLFFGLHFYKMLSDYTYLQNDINRQKNEIALLNEKNSSNIVRVQSASEIVNDFRLSLAGFDLVETSLLSEKSDVVNGWEQWHIQAECTGSLDNIFTFINTLESAGIYPNLDFTIGLNKENLYDLSIKLSFYTI